MAEEKTNKTADPPRHSDERGVDPAGAGPAQPRKTDNDQLGAASAGKAAHATEDTFD
jgi:hypothetical protein